MRYNLNMNSLKQSLVLSTVLLAVLACRPVLAIGWGEIILFSMLLLVLFGPPLFRFYRRLEDFRHHERSNDEKNGKNE